MNQSTLARSLFLRRSVDSPYRQELRNKKAKAKPSAHDIAVRNIDKLREEIGIPTVGRKPRKRGLLVAEQGDAAGAGQDISDGYG
jgi:hypothetical protein